MLIEALIKTRPPGSGNVKAFGDVIVVKPLNAAWSVLEKKVHQLVVLDTAELKKKDDELTGKVMAVEQAFSAGISVISNPFSYEDKTDPLMPVITLRSRVKIDFDLLPKAEADQIKNPSVEVSKLDTAKTKSLIVLKNPKAK